MSGLFHRYFKNLYRRTMRESYAHAHAAIRAAPGHDWLECGAGDGAFGRELGTGTPDRPLRYTGIEWNPDCVRRAAESGLNLLQADLNRALPVDSASRDCVFALSVLEHLLYPCRFLGECHRALRPGGRLVLLTPNISTYFTLAQILLGKMPSSGPHPDSNALQAAEEPFRVVEGETTSHLDDFAQHRHLLVFSYRVLARYLDMLGFDRIEGRGFGLYPLPNFTQPIAERIDPWHCHQMVFVAHKRA